MKYFVTAIGTDSGKTLVSAVLCEILKADYWKPIQSGYPRDTETLQSLLSSHQTLHPERHLFQMPIAPHAAAKAEGIAISLQDFSAPPHTGDLIIEGAGGCLVPLNPHHTMIDLALSLDCRIILVSNFYLGSINHTLLAIHYLKTHKCPVHGIIFNGPYNKESADIIRHYSPWPILFHMPQLEVVNKEEIQRLAHSLRSSWK